MTTAIAEAKKLFTSATDPKTKFVFNLTFHGIGHPPANCPSDEHKYWIELSRFEDVIDRIRNWGSVRITFDDGNVSDLQAAAVLAQRGLKGIFFVVTDRIEKPGYLSKSGLYELLSAGMEIGFHGLHHRPWRPLDDGALRSDIANGAATLEDVLGQPILQAACPFGAYGRQSLKVLSGSGFCRVYTSDRGWAKTDEWLQARNTLVNDTPLSFLDDAQHSVPRKSFLQTLKIAAKCRR